MKLIRIACLLLISLNLMPGTASAETNINLFHADSYSKLLNKQENNAFVLVVWSVECSSCLKEMSLLKQIHQARPELKMVMLSTDSPTEIDQIHKYQTQFQLMDIEQWVFADENAQKLRFKLDPRWYGELPRTYFYNARHQRMGVSGVLTADNYQQLIDKALN